MKEIKIFNQDNIFELENDIENWLFDNPDNKICNILQSETSILKNDEIVKSITISIFYDDLT